MKKPKEKKLPRPVRCKRIVNLHPDRIEISINPASFLVHMTVRDVTLGKLVTLVLDNYECMRVAEELLHVARKEEERWR